MLHLLPRWRCTPLLLGVVLLGLAVQPGDAQTVGESPDSGVQAFEGKGVDRPVEIRYCPPAGVPDQLGSAPSRGSREAAVYRGHAWLSRA